MKDKVSPFLSLRSEAAARTVLLGTLWWAGGCPGSAATALLPQLRVSSHLNTAAWKKASQPVCTSKGIRNDIMKTRKKNNTGPGSVSE